VPAHRKPELAPFVADREEGLAGEKEVDHHEIRAALLQVAHDLATHLWRGHGDGLRPHRLGAVHQRSSGPYSGSNELASADAVAPFLKQLEAARHPSYARHAEQNEQGEPLLLFLLL
jgi:hypothetical protein